MTTTLLAAGLAIFCLLTVKKPLYAAGLILALLPTYLVRFNISGLPTTFLELLLVVFLFTVFATNLKNLAKIKTLGSINWLIVLFLASGIISVFFSPETTSALGLFKAFVLEPVLFFYALVLIANRQEDYRIPSQFLFAAASILAGFGILQYFTLLGLPLRFWGNGEEVRRIVSIFEYPNALALYLGPIFVYFVVHKIKRTGIISGNWLTFGLALQAGAILLTFSRGAWAGIGITLFFILIEHYSFKRVAVGMIGVIMIGYLVAPIRDRVMQTVNDPSGIARLDLWSAAFNKIKTNPVFGNGLYGFRNTLTEQNFKGEILNYPHNIAFNFWLELGLLGLLSFGGIVYVSVKKYWTNRTVWGLAASCFVAVLVVHGLVDVPYFKNDLSVLFWFMLSILYIK